MNATIHVHVEPDEHVALVVFIGHGHVRVNPTVTTTFSQLQTIKAHIEHAIEVIMIQRMNDK